MNSQKPQNPKADFTENFDSDEMEIDVAYEEISPEEQQAIKKRVSETASANEGNSELVTDMWLDDIIDILDVEEEVESDNTKAKSKNLEQRQTSYSEPEIDSTGEDSRTQTTPSKSNSNELEIESNPSIIEELEPEIKEPKIEFSESTTERTREDSRTQTTPSKSESNKLELKSNPSIIEELEPEIKKPKIEFSESTTERTREDSRTQTTQSKSESNELELKSNPLIIEELEPEIKEPKIEFSESTTERTREDSRTQTTQSKSESDESETQSHQLAIEESEPKIEQSSKVEAETVDSSDTESEQPNSTTRSLLDSEKLTIKQKLTPSTTKTELIADSWLDESEDITSSSKQQNERHQELTAEITELEQQKIALQREINNLKVQKETVIAQQTQEIADSLGYMIEEGTRELKERKKNLLVDIEKLERRKERIDGEMRRNFAGASQDLAVRIQGFKEYLVGSLQDLTTAAERLELPKPEERIRRPIPETPRQTRDRDNRRPRNPAAEANSQPQFTEQAFTDQNRRIRQLLDKYRTQPDYYGSPWQLRRTFEPIHAERVQEWFFDRGGRGAIKGMGSRLQNVLIASATISILHRLHSDRLRVLVLVDTPEKLGEWRRGLQDCLGVSRNDFGSNRGIVLFESADVLVQRADRLLEDKLLPLIIIDETEEQINLALLKFPLWLAFAEKPSSRSSGYLY